MSPYSEGEIRMYRREADFRRLPGLYGLRGPGGINEQSQTRGDQHTC